MLKNDSINKEQFKPANMATMQKINANLWFDNQAEEAAKFYTGIFKNSKIGKISRYGKEGFETHGMPAGSVMTIEFWIEEQLFTALNGGPHFKFNEAVSLVVNCDEQEEVDNYWDQLSDGGDKNAQMCGWLKDKYGLSWQIIPRVLSEMMTDPDREKSGRAMQAMLKMKKLDIATLEKAFNGAG